MMMKKIRFGKTDLRVSELGFGGIPITRLELNEAAQLARYCFEQGINFFDTANIYGDSEVKLGTALQDVRERVILATHSLCDHIEEDLELAARKGPGAIEPEVTRKDSLVSRIDRANRLMEAARERLRQGLSQLKADPEIAALDVSIVGVVRAVETGIYYAYYPERDAFEPML